MRLLAALGLMITLAGCSSIVDGTTQNILVNTNPAGATCGLYRENLNIGTIAATPGTILVQKSKHDITILCVMNGYQQASHFNKSGVAGATVGNILLGGGIGWAIDSMSGADNKYDTPVNVTMVPVQPGSVAAPAVLPPTLSGAQPPVATVTAAAPTSATP
ncbi:hypothetical protein [Teichococcus deserti]|nr:hypothetical protein [Pseudoroseomonas deserti]